MRTDKDKAFAMRRKGKSYREISKTLGMSVSTLSLWFKGVRFSEDIKKALIKESQVENTKRINDLNRVRGDSLKAT